ncbi:TraR/DksA C4-type zinc finger protein [Nitrosovibrio sp. Nv4]|uniref:TraR/DksA C4-type zinc finger protein n=1 Tax=Nitrosovibrio sp. Nv4 TaxID=1945880 RepID=UPI000BD2C6BE|nr:transcriptional regulator, TraR/DksA family [Nitrosovibrio sp. Nv4]
MDQFDRAQALEQAERESILRSQRSRTAEQNKPPLSHCEDCGDEIPKERRLATRGITRCIGCQNVFEFEIKRRGRR